MLSKNGSILIMIDVFRAVIEGKLLGRVVSKCPSGQEDCDVSSSMWEVGRYGCGGGCSRAVAHTVRGAARRRRGAGATRRRAWRLAERGQPPGGCGGGAGGRAGAGCSAGAGAHAKGPGRGLGALPPRGAGRPSGSTRGRGRSGARAAPARPTARTGSRRACGPEWAGPTHRRGAAPPRRDAPTRVRATPATKPRRERLPNSRGSPQSALERHRAI